jgi:uncharacterized membrane protein YphA (DoxX/SURF4 family)
MTLPFAAILLALFGVTMILTTISVQMLRGTPQAKEAISTPARFFLVCLRLAIGWHCFFEGMEKVGAANWSGEPYLRESLGPMSGMFRGIAGDRLVEKLTVNDDTFPSELDQEWHDYLAAFAAEHNFSKDQLARAEGILEQRKKATLSYLRGPGEEVTMISAYPPELKRTLTMPQRLKEFERLQQEVLDQEAKFPTSDKDVHAKWKTAKADRDKWRADLARSLKAETDKMKKALDDVVPQPVVVVSSLGTAIALMSQGAVNATTAVWTPREKEKPGPASVRPVAAWRMLEWSDALVKWGLVILGGCLLVGLFARASSLAMALLLLSFYVAMPPLPGWPESPRLEGHYVIINKTLIEVFALLALTFIPTGRWAGIDALIHLLWPKAHRRAKSGPPTSVPIPM